MVRWSKRLSEQTRHAGAQLCRVRCTTQAVGTGGTVLALSFEDLQMLNRHLDTQQIHLQHPNIMSGCLIFRAHTALFSLHPKRYDSRQTEEEYDRHSKGKKIGIWKWPKRTNTAGTTGSDRNALSRQKELALGTIQGTRHHSAFNFGECRSGGACAKQGRL